MKITALLLRRNRCRKSPTISLFPFLAVLICTMGALVPLLLAIARQARLQALQDATAKAARQQVDAQAERELTEWRVDELKNSRKQAEQQLTQARLALGYVENHAQRLREQGNQLRAAFDNLEKTGTQSGRQRVELEEELQQVRTEIGQAENQLAAAQQDAKSRRRSYAVIPYEGPNRTYRQPIYIECRADAVVLQPEGICLTEADFEEPLEAGNPLNRALRAVRELLLAQKRIKGDGSDEPYPLLLVRPDGITAYYAARAAMKSWRSEVGYELVGKDWDLEYPQADPEAGRVLRAVVAEAREEHRRQALLASMLAGNKPRGGRRAVPGTGLMGGQARGAPPGLSGTLGASAGSSVGPSGGGMAAAGPGGPGNSAAPGSPGGGNGLSSSYQLAGEMTSRPSAGASNPGVSGLPPGSGSPSPNGPSAGGATAQSGSGSRDPALSPDGTTAAAVFGDAKPTQRDSRVAYRGVSSGGLIRGAEPAGSGASSSSPGKGGTSSDGQYGSRAAQAGGVAQATGAGAQAASAGDASAAGSPAGQAGSQRVAVRPGEWIPQEPKPPPQPKDDEPDGKSKHRDGKSKSLADSRGENWGLPNAARGSVGITRPIRVRCSSNRLEIVSDSGEVAGKAIPFGTRTEDAVDGFISAVWEHMKTWGIGGRGMYWRPILRIEVTPDAEFRYVELKALLDSSGLIVERKSG
jgi:hypothetical protein